MGDLGGELLTWALRFLGFLVLCVVMVFLDAYWSALMLCI